MLGTAAAHDFLQHVQHGAKLGVSCGVAVSAFGRALGRLAVQGEPMPVACEVYSLLTPMVEATRGHTPAALVANLTHWLPDASGYAFHLPYDAVQGIQAYTAQPAIQHLMDALPTLQYYIIGIGYIEQGSVLSRIGPRHTRVSYEFNALVDRLGLLEPLRTLEAVGESVYQPFTAHGELLIDQPVLAPLRHSMLFLPLQQLQDHVATHAARVMAIAGGPRKHHAVHAALKAKFFNVLVTDSETAEYVLRQAA
jgi:DNA-binding transcriptional regulator LsrR (DeoR family)